MMSISRSAYSSPVFERKAESRIGREDVGGL